MRRLINRRDFVRTATLAALAAGCRSLPVRARSYRYANDVHSQLNATRLSEIVGVDSSEQLRAIVQRAARSGEKISIAGARHAMGGQQFGTDTINLDIRGLRHIGEIDARRGTIEVGSGVHWPELIAQLVRTQASLEMQWGIAQKQTGADRLTLGGALAANVHGRGLTMKPFVDDVESFTLVAADGKVKQCSKSENSDLFALAIGGYGLFGVVDTIRLRLRPRTKIERVVEVRSIEGLMTAMQQRIGDGFTFGDFQFSIDDRSEGFMREGVFSCYRPAARDAVSSTEQLELSAESWTKLMHLAHSDKATAYRLYTDYYRNTSGQIYWSDTHQLSTYIDDYHLVIDAQERRKGSEMISEIYVPREQLRDFMEEARADFLEHSVNLFYGTIRLIERDDETFLAWAKQPYACVIFNLHVDHHDAGLRHATESFRRLIDMAIRRNGSYYLTYHRWARRDQVEACYPQFERFLALKRDFDHDERFESDWYRHYRAMFS